jgi:small nuclear ribonucleoprotein (snRNP)-like protein
MSASLPASSVPVKLLHEAEGHSVTLEAKSGEIYRGMLDAAEDTMNVHLSSVVHTARDGRVTKCVSRPLSPFGPAVYVCSMRATSWRQNISGGIGQLYRPFLSAGRKRQLWDENRSGLAIRR